MSAIKKIIVLSDKQTGNSPKAVLTLYKNNSGVFGTLKNYDIHIKDAILGISVNSKQELKQHVSFDSRNSHSFKLDKNFNLDGKIGCVLVESRNGKITPLVWGLSGGNENYKQVVMDSLQALVSKMNEINEQNKKPEIVLKKINENDAYKDNIVDKPKIVPKTKYGVIEKIKEENVESIREDSGEFQKRIREKISVREEVRERTSGREEKPTKNQNNDENIMLNLGRLKAKELLKNTQTGFHENFLKANINDSNIFVASALDSSSSMQEVEKKVIKAGKVSKKESNLFESTDEEIEADIDKEFGFYNLIKEQVDELFAKYPSENELEKLIPESKWVKVDYENDGHYYVIGLIYENDALKYICYGVPGTHDKEPPSDFAKYSQWIPLKANQPDGRGYWLMYQDANDGHSVNLEVI